MAISPALYPKLAYNIETDFAPIALTATVPLVLAVAATQPGFWAYDARDPRP